MIAQDMGELRPALAGSQRPNETLTGRITLCARGVIYHKASACLAETLDAADATSGDVLANLQLRKFIRSAAECLKRTAERSGVPLMRVRAFAEADVEAGVAAAHALAPIRLRFELESAAPRDDLDRLLALVEPEIAVEAAFCSAGLSVSLEQLLPLETDM